MLTGWNLEITYTPVLPVGVGGGLCVAILAQDGGARSPTHPHQFFWAVWSWTIDYP